MLVSTAAFFSIFVRLTAFASAAPASSVSSTAASATSSPAANVATSPTSGESANLYQDHKLMALR